MKLNIKKILLFISLLCVLPLSSKFAKAVTDGEFNLISPGGTNLVMACNYALDIRIDPGSNVSNSADIIINYDPTRIDIIDSDSGQSGVQINPGTAYESYFGNVVDTGSGEIRLTGASFAELLQSEDLFGTIEFKSKPNITNASFTIQFDGASETNTLDSNIAESSTSLDALGSVTNVNLNFVQGNCIGDTVSPNINFISPQNNQSNVPLNQNVQINLTDNQSGVDLSTLQILINGELYLFGDPELIISGNPNNYNITIDPRTDFYSNSPSSIVVAVSDFAGNNRQSNISFNFPVQPTPEPTIIVVTPTPTTSVSPTSTPIVTPTSGPTPTTTPSPTSDPTPTSTVTVSPTSTLTTTPTITPSPTTEGDKIPPLIMFVTPISNQNIGNNSEIVITLLDNGAGIDINSLYILINDQRYSIGDFTVRVSGDKREYTITIRDNFDFPEFSASYLSVFVSDLAGNSSVSSINFNTPAADSIEELCKESVEEAKNEPVDGAPLGNTIESLQEKIENSLPGPIKEFVEEAGLFGAVSFLLASPLLFWLISSLVAFLSGGVLIPYFFGLFAKNKNKFGIVLNKLTQEPISLVKINIYSGGGLLLFSRATNLRGRFYLDLNAGEYTLEFVKTGYETQKLNIVLNEKSRVLNTVEIDPIEVKSLATELQFRSFKVNPIVISVYFALAFGFLNLLYTRSLVSMIILGVLILAAIFIPRRFGKKKNI